LGGGILLKVGGGDDPHGSAANLISCEEVWKITSTNRDDHEKKRGAKSNADPTGKLKKKGRGTSLETTPEAAKTYPEKSALEANMFISN